MIAADRDALTCDLAETYGIYDWKALPVSVLATLSAGLRADSRIKMRMAGARVPTRDLLLAIVADCLSTLVWFRTEDGLNGVNRPESFARILLGERPNNQSETESLGTPEEYEREWKKRTGVEHG